MILPRLKLIHGLRNNWFCFKKHSVYLVDEGRLLKMISRILLGVVRTFLSSNYLLQFNLYQKRSIQWLRHTENEEYSRTTEKPCQDCPHEVWSRMACWLVRWREQLLNIYILWHEKKKQHSKDVFKHFINSERLS